MRFCPLHDRVVVERIDPEAKTAGGIIIPTPPWRSRSRAGSSALARAAAMKAAS